MNDRPASVLEDCEIFLVDVVEVLEVVVDIAVDAWPLSIRVAAAERNIICLVEPVSHLLLLLRKINIDVLFRDPVHLEPVRILFVSTARELQLELVDVFLDLWLRSIAFQGAHDAILQECPSL